MLLTEPEIQQVLDKAKAAFPNLNDWEYNNEKNGEYFGFSMWGEFVLNPEELMPRRFFITLDTYEYKWQGCLTVGQHSYLWSSADVGDAHLLDTEGCESLEEAIAVLKAKMVELLAAFCTVL
ncbi:hypothetical protein [Nostoc sp. WHI]|uniref:hypothetical protein n=1 Tax=Nostoc sp. WHI TaxID=2650611 RepID=UPI0018C48274|nr:hypothetical protein [Nostoc sp. WHI]MBG1267354.1 hypothetical protein [Nostoc sp. WHI]